MDELSMAEDVWDWNVDQVASAFGPESAWRSSFDPRSLPDVLSFQRSLVEHGINGTALLTAVNEITLHDNLGVTLIGPMSNVLMIINNMRKQSQKYLEYAWVPPKAPLRTYDRVAYSGSGSEYGSSLFRAPRLDPPWGASPSNASRSYRASSAIPQSVKSGPVRTPPQSPAIIKSALSNVDAIVGKSLERDAELSSDVRRGETWIADPAGRKRRRMAPEPVQLPQTALDGHRPSTTSFMQLGSPDPERRSGNRDDSDGYISHDATVLEVATVAPRSQNPQEPGKVFRDSRGQKRMRPILISQQVTTPFKSTFSAEIDIPNSWPVQSKCDKVNPEKPTFSDAATLKRSRRPWEMYLGISSLSAEDLFYGKSATALGFCNELSQNAQAAIDQQDGEERFLFTSTNKISNGQRLYVHRLLKHYLHSTEPHMLHRDQRNFLIRTPYPSRIGKKHQKLSLTVFSKSSEGVVAIQADREKWSKDSPEVSTEVKTTMFDALGNDLSLNNKETVDGEWDFLEKWKYMDNGDTVVPQLGESGSEGEFDLATWREIEEGRDKMEQPNKRSKTKQLDTAIVMDVIESEAAGFVTRWNTIKLPKLMSKSWRIWSKARRDGSIIAYIDAARFRIRKLSNRLEKIKGAIAREPWFTKHEVTRLCKSMQESIEQNEELKWEISILELQKRPSKPVVIHEKKLERGKVVKESKTLNDSDDEEVSSASLSSDQSDLDDFIVDDEDIDDPFAINPEPELVDDEDGNSSNFDHPLELDQDDNTDHHHRRPSQITDDLIIPDFNYGPSASPTGDLRDTAKDPESEGTVMKRSHTHASAPSASPSVTRSSWALKKSRTAPTNNQEVIDLTQASDPLSPEFPQEAETTRHGAGHCSPSGSNDPYSPIRKMENGFKKPNVYTNVVDLENDTLSTLMNAQNASILTDLSDVPITASLSLNDLVERKDRKRLLTWYMDRLTQAKRTSLINRIENVHIDANKSGIHSALKAIKDNEKRVKGEKDAASSDLMQIAAFFICWSHCVTMDKGVGFDLVIVKDTLKMHGFEDFYAFLSSSLRKYEAQVIRDTPEMTPPEGKPRKVKLLGRKLVERTSFGEAPFSSNAGSTKRRKYAIPESQEGLRQRANAHQRVKERDNRQRLLKNQLELRGINGEDPSTMVVNVGKLSEQSLIYINPKIGERIRPHQREGVQFMWRELITGQQGCLLSHTMGLGKTMQVITLLVTIAEAAKSTEERIREQIPPNLRESRTLILSPPSLVDNWWDEFLMWVPHPVKDTIGELRKVTSTLKPEDRLWEISEWYKHGGVLIIGSITFRDLIDNEETKRKKSGTHKGSNQRPARKPAPLDDDQHKIVRSQLLEGPNIIVADEAHYMKNPDTLITKVMAGFRSKSRIALTGSPLANSLLEYYSLIDWISPGYLGERREFKANFIEPIQEGLYQDSTIQQKRLMLLKLEVLNRDLDPKIQRADISVLKDSLKGKTEFVITIPLTKLQDEAYRIYVDSMLAISNEPGRNTLTTLWAWLVILRLLCNHPKCFRDKLVQKEATSTKSSTSAKPKKKHSSVSEEITVEVDEESNIEQQPLISHGIPQAMIDKQLALFDAIQEPPASTILANKMILLKLILEASADVGDKVLVFSHSIPTLDYIEVLLKNLNQRYLRLDGKTPMWTRQQMTKDFNTQNFNVCLISTKAGGQGVNMYAANRVVIVDESWNPMDEEQAIGRAYRLGQQKHVYVYHLTVGGTFEDILRNQSLFKQQLARRVVDKKNPMRHALSKVREYLFPPKEVEQRDTSTFFERDESVLGRILANQDENLIVRSIDLIESFHREDHEELTAEEKKEAVQILHDEQLRRSDPRAYHSLIAARLVGSSRLNANSKDGPSTVENDRVTSSIQSMVTGVFQKEKTRSGPMSVSDHQNSTGNASRPASGTISTTVTELIVQKSKISEMRLPKPAKAGAVQISQGEKEPNAHVALQSYLSEDSVAASKNKVATINSGELGKDLPNGPLENVPKQPALSSPPSNADRVDKDRRQESSLELLNVILQRLPVLANDSLYQADTEELERIACNRLVNQLEGYIAERARNTERYTDKINQLIKCCASDNLKLAALLREHGSDQAKNSKYDSVADPIQPSPQIDGALSHERQEKLWGTPERQIAAEESFRDSIGNDQALIDGVELASPTSPSGCIKAHEDKSKIPKLRDWIANRKGKAGTERLEGREVRREPEQPKNSYASEAEREEFET